MTADLDHAIHAHRARMPDATRRLLEPRIDADAVAAAASG